LTPKPTRDLLDTGERAAIKEAAERAVDESGLSPETHVYMPARTWVAVVGGIVALVLSGASGYWALARADDGLANRVGQTERRIELAATKDDLKLLRMQMRMDLLSSVWECSKDEKGGMRCSPKLPRGFNESSGQ
jgi:hypothetical protein